MPPSCISATGENRAKIGSPEAWHRAMGYDRMTAGWSFHLSCCMDPCGSAPTVYPPSPFSPRPREDPPPPGS